MNSVLVEKCSVNKGMRFGRLVVVGHPFRANPYVLKRGKKTWVVCRCDCGGKIVTETRPLLSGKTKGCGCIRIEMLLKRITKHGLARCPMYTVWQAIVQRCTNPNDKNFANYGGRGIQICQRWRESVEAFVNDVGPRPSPNHSLDRIDNNGNYEPGNVRWATGHEQGNNRRNNKKLEIGGVTKTVSEWARSAGLQPCVVAHRIRKGWKPELAVSAPKSTGLRTDLGYTEINRR